MDQVEKFLAGWKIDNADTRKVFAGMYQFLKTLDGAKISFVPRPGVTYSLRAGIEGAARPIFALVDVIDDDPESRWLSVCFYEDMISDPFGTGEMIPNGILNEDGYCFDVEDPDPSILEYLKQRAQEAYARALETVG
ncbi:MAG: hypothetical protein QMD09_04295 [Desulfatibacillaceae bacterium]|nr:hypothetical protein [Desulfatibacillaceae bacterium]